MTKKPILRMLMGLPASGKSTHAKELEETGEWVRVNKDDIRKEYFPDWTFKNEKEVLYIEDSEIIAELREGNSVVVDDTNFHPKHKERLEKIAKDEGAEFEVLFIDTPFEECIKRNKKRPNSVPIEVIMGMYRQYIAPLREKAIEYNEDLEEAIIVDVDGTLAHITDRNPYDASRALDDTLDDAVGSIVPMVYRHGYKVIILTGRKAEHLPVTIEWLERNGIEYDEIYTRQDEDNRPDYIVKREIFEQEIASRYNIKFVIDDRPSVCRMWRSIGLKVLQVGDPHDEF